MEHRDGMRPRASTPDVVDVLTILFVIIVLSATLGKLLAAKNPRLAAQLESTIYLVATHLDIHLIAPEQAVAGAPPSSEAASSSSISRTTGAR